MRVLAFLALTAIVSVAADFKAEDGFKLLLSGKNLDGWKTKTGESLSGMSEAYKGRFKLADGVLTIDPSVKGDLYIYTTEETSGDVHVKFDFKPGKGCNNDIFLRGMKFDIKAEAKSEIKNLKLDDWNQFEIIVTGKKAVYKNNGETFKTMDTKNDKSNFGLRAEFGPIEIRHLRIKAAK